MREKAVTINATAATWVVRLDRGLTDSEHRMLEEWLAGDERRCGALARAQAGWLHAERGRVFHAREELHRSRFRSWAGRPGWTVSQWLAASAVVLVFAFALGTWQDHQGTHVRTAVGETREARLSDGSEVMLDPKSAVSIEYQSSIRIVRLDYGQALFKVASDPHRPFVVEAGDVRVRAVGTAFSVSRLTNTVEEVTVAKGTVEVWRLMATAETPVRVSAGNRVLVTPQEIISLRERPDAQPGKTGSIDMNGWTLAEVAAEFNRFNHRTVVIADPDLASLRVVGHFQVTDPEAFVTAAAAMLGAGVRTDGDRLILERSPRH